MFVTRNSHTFKPPLKSVSIILVKKIIQNRTQLLYTSYIQMSVFKLMNITTSICCKPFEMLKEIK